MGSCTQVSLTRKEIKEDKVKVILNNSKSTEKDYFSKFDIRSIIKRNIDYILPSTMFIPNINKYLMEGKILVLNDHLSFKKKGDRELLIKIANTLVGESDGE